MRIITSVILLIIFPGYLYSQKVVIKGKVVDQKGEAVPFANVYTDEGVRGTSADYSGKYQLKVRNPKASSLTASAVGYEKKTRTLEFSGEDTLHLDFKLGTNARELGEVVVTGTMSEKYIKDSPVKVEVISKKFLQSNPENNIIESLQNVNGIQQQVGCGVCGTNSIRINGMEGPYTLVLIDGMPIMSALSSVYGFNGIPNSVIERVEVLKGPSSTLYGTEAVAGVINIITKGPEETPKLGFNSYYTSHGESNVDFSASSAPHNKVSSVLSGNFYHNAYKMDFNDDNFTDIPLSTRLSLFNKWTFDDAADLAFRYYTEDRSGGTMQWTPEFRGSDSIYGESIYTDRMEMTGSWKLPVEKMIKLDFSGNYHQQDSYYGDVHYKADQTVLFSNLIWQESYGKHELLAGLTNRYHAYHDNSPADTDDEQYIPGVFVQDEYQPSNVISLLGGMRLDHHREHGLIFSPRLNIKQQLAEYTILRLNLGTGFREVNLFTEDHAALTGSRIVKIKNDLQPEKSYSAAFNLNQVYDMEESTGTLDFDLFYTYFTNRILPDYDTDPDYIIYDNLDGYSVSRGAALSLQHQFTFPLEAGIGGTFQEVYRVSGKESSANKVEQVFTPVFSGTFKITGELKKWGLKADYTGTVTGPQKLPEYPEPFSREKESPWYTIQNIQLTKPFGHLELYGGIKNIFNWTQDSPLIDPANPFSDHFDTVFAWGPLQARRYFIGVRWNLPHKGHDHDH